MTEVFNIVFHIALFSAVYFQVFILLIFFENCQEIRKEKEFESAETDALTCPSATIIVPCYNEEKTIFKTITSLINLDYPKDKLKIFVVDDGSVDGTFNIIKRFETNPAVKIFRKENGGKWTALNYALGWVETELVGCLDADSFVAPNALKIVAAHFKNPEVMAVTPAIKILNPRNILERIQNIEYRLSIFKRKILSFLNAVYVTPGPFSVFRKQVFDKLGKYREAHQTEDLEIALRMNVNNYKIVSSTRAFVYTVAPNTFRGLVRQRTRWNYGFLKNMFDYYFMIFNKKHGHLGIFILPFMLFSIFLALGLFLIIIYNFIQYLMDYFIKIYTVGFEFSLLNLRFDWFFFNSDALVFLGFVSLVLALTSIILVNKLIEEKIIAPFDTIYFIFFYGFLAPFWLAKSLYHAVFSKKIKW
ncbi:MAG: glycosyltransferase [Candidatus Liptonbacteria bacterium]|nr:glycosyltransferase [Candidatus Liptonbacteria bacterium]